MSGNSPERKRRPLVTVDRIVQIRTFGNHSGEYVALDFSMFGKNKSIIRQTYFDYISAIQVESESLVEQKSSEFFALTHVSASEVYKKVQGAWQTVQLLRAQ